MSIQTKNLIFAGFLLLVMIGLLSWYLIEHPRPTLPTVATSTPAVTTGSDLNKSVVPPAHLIEHGQYYDADLQYPSATTLTDASLNTSAVQLMRTFAENTLASFKQDNSLASITPQDAQVQGLDQNRKYSLTSEYKTYYGTHSMSYALSIYEDSLGAHPNTFFHTFTFDGASGKNLTLADIFNPGSDYLQELSVLARNSLIAQQGSGADPTLFINPGTSPDAANFANFVIDDHNLVLLFAPYQVAAYALGPQTVVIPLSKLSSILKPIYQ